MVEASKTKRIFDGRFEIIGIVGRGSQSVVYHARNALAPDTHVALKVLVNNKSKAKNAQAESLGEQLRKEALAMVAARHRYVIRIEDFHSIDSLCYLSMEYAAEGDLRKYINARNGKLPIAQAQRFFKQIAEALSAVHKSGIIHRDIKPDNILVVNDREVRLGDFGVAVLPGDESSIEELQRGVGTFSYMAPEVLEGIESKEAADIYSLGLTFYEMICGTHPFENVNLIDQLKARQIENVKKPSALNNQVTPELEAAILKCMAYDKKERFQSAQEILDFMSKPQTAAKQKNTADAKLTPKATPLPQVPTQPETQAPVDLRPAQKPVQPKTETSAQQPISPIAAQAAQAFVNAQKPIIEEPKQTTEQIPPPPPPLTRRPTQTDLVHEQPQPHQQQPQEATKEEVNQTIEQILSGLKTTKKAPAKPKQATKKPSLPMVLLLLAVLAAAYYVTQPEKKVTKKMLPPPEPVKVEQTVTDQPLIPEAQDETAAFPLFSAGMHHGEIFGLVPEKSIPLTIISFPALKQIAVIIGLEGFTPVVVSTDGLKAGDKLKVASSGIVLHLTGKNIEQGETVGYFKNLVVGTSGEWRVHHITRQARK